MTEALWQKYSSTRDPEVKEKLLRDYLPLVKQIAGHLSLALPPCIDKDDLISCGIVGLMEAAERYDPSGGAGFRTFAARRIRGAMLDELRRLSWAPRTLFQRLRRLQEAEDKIGAEKGREPSSRELARELGWSVAEVEEVYSQINCLSVVSLDSLLFSPSDKDEEVPGEEGSFTDPSAYLEVREKQEALARAISALPEREKVLLGLYYKEELTLKEIARIMKVTPARVSQIHARAIRQLRQYLQHHGFIGLPP